MNQFRSERLANGVELSFSDCSNRYFGDYHRVRVDVLVRVPATSGTVETIRHLERMAVPGAQVAAVRERLVDDFLRHAARYLAHPDYPQRLAATLSSGREHGRRP
jgi:hypothetical protein